MCAWIVVVVALAGSTVLSAVVGAVIGVDRLGKAPCSCSSAVPMKPAAQPK